MKDKVFKYSTAKDYWFNEAIPTLMVLVESEEDAVFLGNSSYWEGIITGYQFYALLYGQPAREIRKFTSRPSHMQIADAKMAQPSYPWENKEIVL